MREFPLELSDPTGGCLEIDGDSYRMRGHRARLAQLRAAVNQRSDESRA